MRNKNIITIIFFLFTAVFLTAPMATTAQELLVLHLPFNEGSGAVASDSSGHNNNAAVGSQIFASGISGSALSITTSYGTIADNSTLRLSQDMSFAVWIKPSVASGTFLEKGIHAPSGVNYIFGYNPCCGLKFTYSDGNFRDTYDVSGFAPTVGQWDFISITVNKASNTVKFYVNGVLASAVPCANNCSYSTNMENSYLGSNTSGEQYNGALDELRLFDYALSAEEVKMLYDDGLKSKLNLNSCLGMC